LGVSLGALTAGLLTTFLAADTLLALGWRGPFLMGVAIAPLRTWIRRRLGEQLPQQASAVRMPVLTVLRDHWRRAALGILLTIGSTVTAYVVTFYMPTYAIHE